MKVLSGLAKFIAILIVILFVVALPLAILAYDVGHVVFNPPLVKQVLNEIVTESNLLPAALAWYSDTRAKDRYAAGEAEAWVEEPDIVSLIEFMDLQDWIEIRWEVLTDPILIDWVSATVDGTYEWIDSDDAVPQISWSMQNFISRVDSDHGTQSITIAYEALPPCNDEQIADFKSRLEAAPPGTEVLYNLCEFPDPWYEDQFGDYLESLEDLIENIPTVFHLTDSLAQIEDTVGVGSLVLKTQLRLIRWMMKLMPLVPILLMLLILILAIRSMRGVGQWWGIPITIGGAFALLLALVRRPLVTRILIAGPLSETPDLILEDVLGGLLILADYIFKPMLWQSMIVLIVGIGMIVLGSFYKSKQKSEDAELLERIQE